MIMRKPYAFLIKHFKLFHLIITFVLGYLVLCSNKIYSFLNDCIKDSFYKYDALEYINYSIYFWILLGILLFLVMYWLFKYKDKPKKIYVVSILGYVFVGIFMFILFNYMNELPNSILEQKVIRGYRDVMTIVLGFQYLIVVIMFIRGLGFNIRKFDFDDDNQDLNLSVTDNEEVEVNINIDTTNIMRNVRKQKRELGYYFQEYKIFILGILGIVIVIILFKLFSSFNGIFNVYNQNEVIGNINYITINKSYYELGDENNYIIISFDIFKNGVEEQLNVDKMVLKVGDYEYYPNRNTCFKFNKLGNCYKKQFVTDDVSSYILTYEVDAVNLEKAYLLYKESYDDTFKVKLNLENYE